MLKNVIVKIIFRQYSVLPCPSYLANVKISVIFGFFDSTNRQIPVSIKEGWLVGGWVGTPQLFIDFVYNPLATR